MVAMNSAMMTTHRLVLGFTRLAPFAFLGLEVVVLPAPPLVTEISPKSVFALCTSDKSLKSRRYKA